MALLLQKSILILIHLWIEHALAANTKGFKIYSRSQALIVFNCHHPTDSHQYEQPMTQAEANDLSECMHMIQPQAVTDTGHGHVRSPIQF